MATDIRLKEALPEITEAVVATYSECNRTSHLGHRALPSREAIAEILEDFLDMLYPGIWRRQNLHMGNYVVNSPVCHMDNTANEVEVKSHYTSGTCVLFFSVAVLVRIHSLCSRRCCTSGGSDGMGAWYAGQHSFLRANTIQVGADALLFWVR